MTDGAPLIPGAGRFGLGIGARSENLRRVRRALEGLPIPPDLIEDAKLLTTELATNCIRHARLRPDDDIRVTADWTSERLRVSVRDRGSGIEGSRVAGAIRPSPGARSGWGLYFVDRLSTRWGASLDGGTEFWFELDLAPRER
ncbi:MAG TPA: ATP-binding protein [Actinomycetota bacterium]